MNTTEEKSSSSSSEENALGATQQNSAPEMHIILKQEIEQFHNRARILQHSAIIVLFLIGGIVGLGVYVFIDAGKIAVSDIERSVISQVQFTEARTESRISSLLSSVNFITQSPLRATNFIAEAASTSDVVRSAILQRFPQLTSDFQPRSAEEAAEVIRFIIAIASTNPDLLNRIENFVRIETITSEPTDATDRGSIQ